MRIFRGFRLGLPFAITNEGPKPLVPNAHSRNASAGITSEPPKAASRPLGRLEA